MAKKRRKRRAPAETLADTPVAKKKRKRRRKSEPRPESSGDDTGEISRAPTTKKSTLPPELAHDDREVDARSIKRFTGILLVIVIASMIGVWVLNDQLIASERSEHEAPGPMATSLPTAPAEPKLQRVPRDGLAALRTEEQQQLGTYGWEDEKRGVVRIPIDRAIELLAERGLPTRGAPVDDHPHFTVPTDGTLRDNGALRDNRTLRDEGGQR